MRRLARVVPFFYTPGYPAALAALGKIFGGVDFGLARSVSLAATLFTLWLLFQVVRRETDTRFGFIAVGLYAALFRTNGAFYDLARPDSLYIAIVFSGCILIYREVRWRGVFAASIVFCLGFLTKQTSSVFVPPLVLYLLWRDWRQGLVFAALTTGLTSGAVWLIDQATDGWFWTYIFGTRGISFIGRISSSSIGETCFSWRRLCYWSLSSGSAIAFRLLGFHCCSPHIGPTRLFFVLRRSIMCRICITESYGTRRRVGPS